MGDFITLTNAEDLAEGDTVRLQSGRLATVKSKRIRRSATRQQQVVVVKIDTGWRMFWQLGQCIEVVRQYANWPPPEGVRHESQ